MSNGSILLLCSTAFLLTATFLTQVLPVPQWAVIRDRWKVSQNYIDLEQGFDDDSSSSSNHNIIPANNSRSKLEVFPKNRVMMKVKQWIRIGSVKRMRQREKIRNGVYCDLQSNISENVLNEKVQNGQDLNALRPNKSELCKDFERHCLQPSSVVQLKLAASFDAKSVDSRLMLRVSPNGHKIGDDRESHHSFDSSLDGYLQLSHKETNYMDDLDNTKLFTDYEKESCDQIDDIESKRLHFNGDSPQYLPNIPTQQPLLQQGLKVQKVLVEDNNNKNPIRNNLFPPSSTVSRPFECVKSESQQDSHDYCDDGTVSYCKLSDNESNDSFLTAKSNEDKNSANVAGTLTEYKLEATSSNFVNLGKFEALDFHDLRPNIVEEAPVLIEDETSPSEDSSSEVMSTMHQRLNGSNSVFSSTFSESTVDTKSGNKDMFEDKNDVSSMKRHTTMQKNIEENIADNFVQTSYQNKASEAKANESCISVSKHKTIQEALIDGANAASLSNLLADDEPEPLYYSSDESSIESNTSNSSSNSAPHYKSKHSSSEKSIVSRCHSLPHQRRGGTRRHRKKKSKRSKSVSSCSTMLSLLDLTIDEETDLDLEREANSGDNMTRNSIEFINLITPPKHDFRNGDFISFHSPKHVDHEDCCALSDTECVRMREKSLTFDSKSEGKITLHTNLSERKRSKSQILGMQSNQSLRLVSPTKNDFDLSYSFISSRRRLFESKKVMIRQQSSWSEDRKSIAGIMSNISVISDDSLSDENNSCSDSISSLVRNARRKRLQTSSASLRIKERNTHEENIITTKCIRQSYGSDEASL